MDNKNKKTLYVFVHDSVNVSDDYKEKGFHTKLVEKPVLVVFDFSFLTILFKGVRLFARPPTSQFNFLNQFKKPLVY